MLFKSKMPLACKFNRKLEFKNHGQVNLFLWGIFAPFLCTENGKDMGMILFGILRLQIHEIILMTISGMMGDKEW